MTLSKEEKKATLAVGRRRYADIKGKKAKGRFLDAFCAVTGLTRKHAIATLTTRAAKHHPRRGPPKKHSMDAVNLLARVWRMAGKPCGKLLRPVLDTHLASLRKHGQADEKTAAQVLSMSASTIDRRLRSVKPRAGGSRRRSDSLAEHRRAIGLKIDLWPADAKQTPGWLELDTVAHCGGSMAGSFMWTLTACDIATQWTEMRPAWNRGAHAICAAFRDLHAALPMPVRGLNTDNGHELVNELLAREFAELFPNAVRSRSRSYVKNDNPHVEQKNGHAVRRILGYGRIGRDEAVPLARELLTAESLYRNLFLATFKLVDKRREGARWVKRFEAHPQTPAQRVLASADIPEACKERVRALLRDNDPVLLRRKIDAAARALVRLLASPFGACSSFPAAPARPSDAPTGSVGPILAPDGQGGGSPSAQPLNPRQPCA
jgi:hypothetical protein